MTAMELLDLIETWKIDYLIAEAENLDGSFKEAYQKWDKFIRLSKPFAPNADYCLALLRIIGYQIVDQDRLLKRRSAETLNESVKDFVLNQFMKDKTFAYFWYQGKPHRITDISVRTDSASLVKIDWRDSCRHKQMLEDDGFQYITFADGKYTTYRVTGFELKEPCIHEPERFFYSGIQDPTLGAAASAGRQF